MERKIGRLAKRVQPVMLNAEGIDHRSGLIAEALTEAGTDRKDVIHLRLASLCCCFSRKSCRLSIRW